MTWDQIPPGLQGADLCISEPGKEHRLRKCTMVWVERLLLRVICGVRIADQSGHPHPQMTTNEQVAVQKFQQTLIVQWLWNEVRAKLEI